MAYFNKKIQISRPVHVIFQSDKLDYFGGPRKEKKNYNFFSIGQGPSNVGKLNWNLLGFFPIHIQYRAMCMAPHPQFISPYSCQHELGQKKKGFLKSFPPNLIVFKPKVFLCLVRFFSKKWKFLVYFDFEQE